MIVDFWNNSLHPITGYKHASHDSTLTAKRKQVKINYIKPGDFNPFEWVETKELMQMFNLSAPILSIKSKELGYTKITHKGKKFVEREIIKELTK